MSSKVFTTIFISISVLSPFLPPGCTVSARLFDLPYAVNGWYGTTFTAQQNPYYGGGYAAYGSQACAENCVDVTGYGTQAAYGGHPGYGAQQRASYNSQLAQANGNQPALGYSNQPVLGYGIAQQNGYASDQERSWSYGPTADNNYRTFQISLPINTRFPAHIQLPYSNTRLSLVPVNGTLTVPLTPVFTTATTMPTTTTTTTMSTTIAAAVTNENYSGYTDLSNLPSTYCNSTKRATFRRHSTAQSAGSTASTVRLPLVLPILYGAFHSQGNRLAMYPSVVLVIDENSKTRERRFIMVDTGLSHLKDSVVSGLQAHGVEPSMIDTVVITHPDTDTMGNLNLFPCAQIFASNRISKENLFVERAPPTFNTNRSELPFHRLFDHTELYLTPGFGLQDQSLVVHNVENHGSVAIVGKLILNQTELVGATDMAIREFASDDAEQRKLWLAARREIVCLADYVIPGHGVPFKISAELKRLAECSHHDRRAVKQYFVARNKVKRQLRRS